MSARTIVADALHNALPAYRVYPYGVTPDDVPGTALCVERTAVAPGLSAGLREETVAVYVLTGIEDTARAEDALDAALDALLAVLERLPALRYTGAERVALADRFHAYQVTITVQTKN